MVLGEEEERVDEGKERQKSQSKAEESPAIPSSRRSLEAVLIGVTVVPSLFM